MKNTRYTMALVSLFVLLMSITWTGEARADVSDRKTLFSINQPVRVPGNVVLPPGKYVMKMADPAARGLVSIMDAREGRLYTTFFANPEELRVPAQQAQLVLGEAPKGFLEQIKAWYYPGLNTAFEFPN